MGIIRRALQRTLRWILLKVVIPLALAAVAFLVLSVIAFIAFPQVKKSFESLRTNDYIDFAIVLALSAHVLTSTVVIGFVE